MLKGRVDGWCEEEGLESDAVVLRPQPPSRKTKDCPSASLHHMALKRVMVMLGALRVRLRERGCRGRWWRGDLGPANISL